jgi:hypothetical protein
MFFRELLKESGGVIVSRRNSGFGDNLLAAANAWRYARATGRSLAILWTRSRYLEDPAENAFPKFFAIPENVGGVRVIAPPRVDILSMLLLRLSFALSPRPDAGLFGARLLSALGMDGGLMLKSESRRREAVIDGIVEGLTDVKPGILVTQGCYGPKDELKPFFDAVRLAPRLAGIADDFARENFAGKKVVGVHVRYYGPHLPVSNHTPYWREWKPGIKACIDGINKARDMAGGGEQAVVFLSTDSRPVEELLTRSVRGVVTYPKPFGRNFGGELHDELPVETAEASAIEMFLLARSDVLFRYPPGSWFSHYASLYAGRVLTVGEPPPGE